MPTGTVASNDVIRRFNEYVPTVAAFKPERLTAVVTGPTTIPTLVNSTWEANVSCGGGGYTYQWAESINGITYTNITGATNITLTQMALPGGGFSRYKRVSVTSTDGQINSAFIFITVQQPIALKSTETSQIEENLNSAISIKDEIITYPNPILNSTTVGLNILSEGPTRLDFVNENGVIIKTIFENNTIKGNQSILFNSKAEKPGLYYFKLTTRSGIKTQRVIIN